jgi:hypothetical protein
MPASSNVRAPLLAILVVSGVIAASAQAGSGDANTTRAYLRADELLLRSTLRDVPAGAAALARFDASVNTECQGVLTGAPKVRVETPRPGELRLGPRESLEFSLETLDAVSIVLEEPNRPPLRRFSRTISRLRWTSRSLTRLVRSNATAQLAQAETTPPNLCADAKAWAASGYKTLSPGTERFLKHQKAIEAVAAGQGEFLESPERAIVRRLRRFENASARRAARHVARLTKEWQAAVLAALKGAGPTI